MKKRYERSGTSLRKGQARVEFSALREEIVGLTKKGHTLKAIHEQLTSENRMTMKYETLTNLFRKCFGKWKKFYEDENYKNTENTEPKTEEKIQNDTQPANQQPQKGNHRPELNEKKDFINHDYDPIGGESTENKKEEENKGDNK